MVPFDDPQTDAEADAALPPQTEALSGFLAAIEGERTAADAGGVPIPHDWECVRAVLGRVPRDVLERAHDTKPAVRMSQAEADWLHAREKAQDAAKKGTHLPAGLHVVTGQTGGGKSALVTSLALAAAEAGHPVLYISLELDGEELAARVLALKSGVPWYKLSLGESLTPEEQSWRTKARQELEQAGVPERFLIHAPVRGLSVQTVRTEALAAWERWGKVPLVVLDYLQLATVFASGSRLPLREAIAAVVLEMRHLSRRDKSRGWPGCPVVLLSTTARSNTKGADAVEGLNGENPDALRRDNMEALKALPKEAGEIEATAVTAWVIALGERTSNGTRELALRLVKNRLGIPGAWVPFVFHGATGLLEEAPGRYAVALAEDREKKKKKKDTKDTKEQITDITPEEILGTTNRVRQ